MKINERRKNMRKPEKIKEKRMGVIETSIDSKEYKTDRGIATYYFDKLKTGRYQVCRDEYIIKLFDDYYEAKEYFDMVGIQWKNGN